ncbi:MAG: motility associated factor glycosyltransferase family protein, partial [Fibrobacterota bacterium]
MSESLYEKNLKVLMKKQAYLGHALQERDPSEPMKRYDLRDVNGVPVLLYRRSSGEEILFTSMLDPVAAARSYAEEIDYSRNRFTVIQIGLGLGLVAEEILTRLNQKALLFICEPHLELIQAVLALRDFSEYIENGNLLFICGDLQKVSPAEQIRRFSYIAFPNMTSKNQPVTFPVYDIEYIGFANAMLRRFQDEKNYVKFGIGNNVDDTLVGWDNYLVNNEYVMRHMGIREFKRLAGDRYKKRPAFIVASGPSLNKNVHLLKDVDDSALILSCDGSMDLLKRMGITVDAVGSVERIKYTHDCFYRGRDFPDETLVVAPSVVYPGIYEKFDKGIAFPKGGIPTAEWVNQFSDDKKGAMACGPSVAHMLFNFAWEAGCEPIVLLGQDLAYSPEGYSHNTDADGVLERLEIKEKYEYWVDDYEG